ncbi:MAG: hypothetical protein AAF938_03385 [Myxococcota bacterium]
MNEIEVHRFVQLEASGAHRTWEYVRRGVKVTIHRGRVERRRRRTSAMGFRSSKEADDYVDERAAYLAARGATRLAEDVPWPAGVLRPTSLPELDRSDVTRALRTLRDVRRSKFALQSNLERLAGDDWDVLLMCLVRSGRLKVAGHSGLQQLLPDACGETDATTSMNVVSALSVAAPMKLVEVLPGWTEAMDGLLFFGYQDDAVEVRERAKSLPSPAHLGLSLVRMRFGEPVSNAVREELRDALNPDVRVFVRRDGAVLRTFGRDVLARELA